MPTGRNFRYWLLVGLVTAWLFLLVWPALGTELGWKWSGMTFFLFTPVCHQIPDRSFFLWGHQLAVCHRCSGIYFGFWLGLLLLPLWGKATEWLVRRPRLMVWFLLPMLLDVVVPNAAWDRFATGFVFAFPFSVIAWSALEQISLRGLSGRKVYERQA